MSQPTDAKFKKPLDVSPDYGLQINQPVKQKQTGFINIFESSPLKQQQQARQVAPLKKSPPDPRGPPHHP